MKQLIAGFLSLLVALAYAQSGPIKIGEINSYSSMPQFTTPYRQGWQLAVEEINAAGGLLGRKVEVIARDDAGRPEEALRHAGELTSNEKVDVLAGGFLSNVGLALADHAAKNKRPNCLPGAGQAGSRHHPAGGHAGETRCHFQRHLWC